MPEIVDEVMNDFEKMTGRKYDLFQYTGAPDAERIIIIMGSPGETVTETVKALNESGEKVGVIQIRLYRPFSLDHFLKALPPTTKSIAVLDQNQRIRCLRRTNLPGCVVVTCRSYCKMARLKNFLKLLVAGTAFLPKNLPRQW